MKYVSINGQTIRKNIRRTLKDPPIRIAKSPNDKNPMYANEIEIIGPARLVYDPENRLLACGARLVLVCEDVKIIYRSYE